MRSIRPWLWIGRYRDLTESALLKECGIHCILQLIEGPAIPGIEQLVLPISDGVPIPTEALSQGIAFIQKAHAANKTLMIACGAGVSRSVSFTIAALNQTEGLGLLESFRTVKRLHPEALPHPVLWASLCAHYGESIPYRQTRVLPE